MCDYCEDESDVFNLGGKVACCRCASKAAFKLADEVTQLKAEIAELKKKDYREDFERVNGMLARQQIVHRDELFDLRNEIARAKLGIIE